MLGVIRPALRRLMAAPAPLGASWFRCSHDLLLASVCVTEALGVHDLFGAFLAGIVMPKGGEVEAEFRGRLEFLSLVVLLPLFFAYTGLRTSFELLNSGNSWLLCGLILMVAVASKFLVSAGCVRVSGMSWREALAVGVLVNTSGLVELVILNAGLDLHILSPALYSMMVITAVITTLVTGPLIDRILRAHRYGAIRHQGSMPSSALLPGASRKARIRRLRPRTELQKTKRSEMLVRRIERRHLKPNL